MFWIRLLVLRFSFGSERIEGGRIVRLDLE